jgi:hypothetical protein
MAFSLESALLGSGKLPDPMKKMTLLSVLFLLCLVARGQDPKGAQTLMESQVPRKEIEAKKAKVVPPKPTDQVVGKRVLYGGYLTELAKSEKKRSFFNLRTPLDPQKDQENLSYYPGTDQVQAIVLFNIKF